MSRGKCVIIDRCNFDFDQRKVWYELAREFNYPLDCIVLIPSTSLCIQRCKERKNHETISPKDAYRIVTMVQRQWQIPTREEQDESIRHYHILQSSSEEEFQAAVQFHVHC